MIRSAIREFRAAPVTWASVFVVLSVVQTALGTVSIMLSSSYVQSKIPGMSNIARGVGENQIISVVFMIFTAVLVVMQIVVSAINQRRRNLALLSLQGATPWQLTWLTTMQVMCLTFVASLVSLVSFLIAPKMYSMMTSFLYVGEQPFYSKESCKAWLLGITAGFCTAMIGTLITIRKISKISPTEALLESIHRPRKIGFVRLICAVICTIAAVLLYTIPILTTHTLSWSQVARLTSGEVLMPLVGALSLAPLLLLIAISLEGPNFLGVVVRIWTRSLILPFPSWKVARIETEDRIRRSALTMIPLIVGVTLLMTIDGYYFVGAASSELLPNNIDIESADMPTLLSLLGPALLIVLAGVGSGFLIESQSRGVDMALFSLEGADNEQLNAIAAYDGAITVINSMLIALIVTVLSDGAYAIGLRRILGVSRFDLPWKPWLITFGILICFGVLSSWMTAAVMIRKSPTRILAQNL